MPTEANNVGKRPVAEFQCDSFSEDDTFQLGATLAAALQPGTVVALTGELGTGKTRLVQAVAEGLGVDRSTVTSPTFVLIQEYSGRLPIYHFDTYRLRDSDEFLHLGAEELFDADGVCLIEWADRVRDVLPRDVLDVTLEATGRESRRLRWAAHGPRSQAVLERIVASTDLRPQPTPSKASRK